MLYIHFHNYMMKMKDYCGEVKGLKRFSFTFADFFYTIILCNIIGEYSLLVIFFLVFGVCWQTGKHSYILPSMLTVRFTIFTYLYGLEKCHLFLTMVILYVEAVLSRLKIIQLKLLIPIFLTFIFLSDNMKIPCSLPSEILNYVNIVTRLYVLSYLSAKLCISKIEAKLHEKKLSDQAKELSELEEDEMNFMKRFSHFSKTLLNGIINFLSFLRNTNELSHPLVAADQDLGTCLDTIEMSSNEVLRQSSEMVEYFELRKGSFMKGKSNEEIVEIPKLVDYVFRVQSKIRLELDVKKKKNVVFSIHRINEQEEEGEEGEEEEDKYMICDGHFLSKVLMNITSNALKYTRKGFVKILYGFKDLKKKNDNKKRELVVKVLDTGMGIREEILDRVYEPFLKTPDSVQSFSVGLVIAKSIVTKLGGELEIKSPPPPPHQSSYYDDSDDDERGTTGGGRGTLVTLSIPFRPPSKEEVEKYEEELEDLDLEKQNEEAEEGMMLEKVRNTTCLGDILILEDNIINRKVLEKHIEMIFKKKFDLSFFDYNDDDELSYDDKYDKNNNNKKPHLRIYEAEDGVQGLSILSSIYHRNPLIITDIDMPHCNGIEFCERARKKYVHSGLVIYAITATITGDKQEFCRKHGFDGVSLKPIRFAEMKKIFSGLVDMRLRTVWRNTIMSLEFEKMKGRLIIEKNNGTDDDDDDDDHNNKNNKYNNNNNEEKGKKNNKKKKKTKYSSEKRKTKFEAVVSIENWRDVAFKFVKDIGLTIFTIFVTYGLYALCPEEFAYGWRIFGMCFFWLSVFQYASLIILRFSAETNNIMSILRIFLTMIIASELSFFKLLRIVYLSQFSYIMQANESVDSVSGVIVLTLLFYVKIVYYEITRSKMYFTYDHPYTNLVYKVSLSYFMIHVVWLSYQFVSNNLDRKRRWMKIIEEKKKIEAEINLTNSKISHDLATPASALVLYLEEVRLYLIRNGLIGNYKNYSKNKNDHDPRSYHYSEVFEYFQLMISCSFELELSIHNFLTCCKIKNGMIVTRLVPNVDFKEFMKSITDRCQVLIQGQVGRKLRLKYDENLMITDDDDDSPFYVCMDMEIVRLILMNLIVNSIIHSKATSIRVKCSLSNEEEEEEVNRDKNIRIMKISVIDNGIGIDEKYAKERVDVFHFKERFSNTLGLGLVVSKFLTKEMKGGKIEIKTSRSSRFSNHNLNYSYRRKKGTVVEFSFPFKYYIPGISPSSSSSSIKNLANNMFEDNNEVVVDMFLREEGSHSNNYGMKLKDLERIIDEKEEEEEEEEFQDIHTILRKKKLEDISVLCIDDSSIIGGFLKMILEKIGFRDVQVANHENEGIQILEERRPQFDLLLCDYNLVNINIYQLFKKLDEKRIPNFSLPSVIVCVTGAPEKIVWFNEDKNNKEEEREEREERENVIHAVISKPIHIASLKNTLRRFIDIP